ncbi:MAG: glycosyltransferase [Clostridium sp.]|uniref:glycosyltransferase n=1 Tax=Clostridium sp. TaxID=1506 RepID=UPI002FCB2311
MRDILFVIDSLTYGGAEKSLVSLLNNMDFSKYRVDILLFKREGELERLLPENVNILAVPKYFIFTNEKINIIKHKNIKFLAYRISTSLKLRMNNKSKNKLHSEQVIYSSVRNVLPMVQKKYDVAIAYSQGFPTYFVVEKVKAIKKLAWINCDYVKTMYDKEFDNKYYKKMDNIIVVSEYIYESMKRMKYNYKEKLKVILDIIDPNFIKRMSLLECPKDFNCKELKILTVGRLVWVKGYDIAVQAAKLLKESGYKFKWYVIGEGNERKKIEELISQYKLDDCFILLGSRMNPYVYMDKADIYVQTSRKEGFGLSVIEAKILKKLIVCTNFETAKELIKDNYDGQIVNINPFSIAEGIKEYIDNDIKVKKVEHILNTNCIYSTVNEINKLYEIIADDEVKYEKNLC